jgi:hypothetical protein
LKKLPIRHDPGHQTWGPERTAEMLLWFHKSRHSTRSIGAADAADHGGAVGERRAWCCHYGFSITPRYKRKVCLLTQVAVN